jgi:hypothetical protein
VLVRDQESEPELDGQPEGQLRFYMSALI